MWLARIPLAHSSFEAAEIAQAYGREGQLAQSYEVVDQQDAEHVVERGVEEVRGDTSRMPGNEEAPGVEEVGKISIFVKEESGPEGGVIKPSSLQKPVVLIAKKSSEGNENHAHVSHDGARPE